jgi:hypothetical protein
MKNKILLVTFVFIGSALFAHFINILPLNNVNAQAKAKVNRKFVARVQLETNCEFVGDVFSIINKNTGQIAPFRYGEAFLTAETNHKLELVVSPRYSQFLISEQIYSAQKNLKISYDCGSSRLNSIFNSLNDQFTTKD